MEALGGAAAVIATVQTAFSFYAADFQEPGDDILSLTNEIDSTFGQLRISVISLRRTIKPMLGAIKG